MLGSCSFSSFWGSSCRHVATTSQLLRHVTASRLPYPTFAGPGLATRPPCLRCPPAGRETARWLSHSVPGHEKEKKAVVVASPSPPSPPTCTLLDPASPHSSLESFHAHALRTGLSPTSTVYAGTTYEYLAQDTLRRYGFRLHRVGGRGDRGVDLVGVWEIPILSRAGGWKMTREERKGHDNTAPTQRREAPGVEDVETGGEALRLQVLVQCKRLVGRHARIGPNLVRELDGAVRATRSAAWVNMVCSQAAVVGRAEEDGSSGSSSEDEPRESSLTVGPAIGVLVGTRPATKGVVDSMSRSTRGLVWVMMEEATDQETGVGGLQPANQTGSIAADRHPPSSSAAASLRGRVKQMLWNHAAREAGLEGVDVVKRYDSDGEEEVVLMRGGRVWGGRARK